MAALCFDVEASGRDAYSDPPGSIGRSGWERHCKQAQ
jgi:hypothetical protein